MRQYKQLVNHVLKHGYYTENRTDTPTLSAFGYQMRFDLQEGFPLLTLREINFDMIVSELLWFIEGSTDERRLAEIRYGKPAKELAGKKTIWTANADKQGKELGYKNTDTCKELGPVYGENWRSWPAGYGDYIDQLQNAIDLITSDPLSRRNIVTAWNPDTISDAALPPCHVLYQFKVTGDRLNCHLFQRSADVFLGIPANIASYSLLTHMVAMICDLEVGTFVHTISDAHIYENHIPQCKELLARESFRLPELQLEERKNINGFTMDDFSLIGYSTHSKLTGVMAV